MIYDQNYITSKKYTTYTKYCCDTCKSVYRVNNRFMSQKNLLIWKYISGGPDLPKYAPKKYTTHGGPKGIIGFYLPE